LYDDKLIATRVRTRREQQNEVLGEMKINHSESPYHAFDSMYESTFVAFD
jgi:hypothetical protein